jgi:hypothetical protein
MPQLKQFARFVFVDAPWSRLLRWPPARAILGVASGAYFLIYSTVPESLPLLANFPAFYERLFVVLVVLTVVGTMWQAFGDMIVDNRLEYTETLEELLVAVGSIISAKIFRFQSKAQSVTSRQDVFALITHPEEQTQVILDQAKEFLVRRCGVKSDQFDITVIRVDPYKKTAYYFAQATRNLERTEPRKLQRNSSAAKACIDSGEPLFIPDKKTAAERGKYFVSERDKRYGGTGSIYCYPVLIPLKEVYERFLVTFTTYGATICSPGDKQAEESIVLLFNQFAKRIELELTLFALKEAKANAKKSGYRTTSGSMTKKGGRK